MCEYGRGSAHRQTHVRNKAHLALRLISIFIISLTCGVSLSAQTYPTADWWAINKAVAEQLSVNDLGEVIKSLPRAAPIGDVVELVRQLNLFVRAGHRHRATQVIDRLPKDADASYKSLLSQVADFLIGREEWDLARRFLERAPQAEPGWGYVLIKRWAEKGDPSEIDRWLAARMEENSSYWLFERLRFRTQLRTEGELLDILANDVKAHPADLARARRYVNAVETAGNKFNLDWMGDTCKPALAFECYQLGNAVAPRSPRAAIPLFERALSLPFTDQDKKLLHENIISRLANSFVFMVNALPRSKRDLFWARAEKLATMTDPTRAYILGEVMVTGEEPVRAIPLLKDAIQRLVTDNEKERATHDLYRAYIETDNWKAAEDMWPSLLGGIKPNASPDTFGEIAVAAAKAQSPDDALRFWRAKANLDRGDLRFLSDLARLGLKERLRSFYQQLAKDDPESWAPKAALQLLR